MSPDVTPRRIPFQPNTAINCWIAAILLFDFKLAHVPADKHKGPNGLSRCEPAPGEEDDNPEDWVDNTLSLSLWVVSWLDTFPSDAHHTDTLVLSLEANTNNDEDFAQHTRPRRDRRLPTRYRTGDFISSNSPRALSHFRPPANRGLHVGLCQVLPAGDQFGLDYEPTKCRETVTPREPTTCARYRITCGCLDPKGILYT